MQLKLLVTQLMHHYMVEEFLFVCGYLSEDLMHYMVQDFSQIPYGRSGKTAHASIATSAGTWFGLNFYVMQLLHVLGNEFVHHYMVEELHSFVHLFDVAGLGYAIR